MFEPIVNQICNILNIMRRFSVNHTLNQSSSKIVVVGGGSGGCAVAAKFVRNLGKNHVTIIEPAVKHYYKPMFTLVGGGIKKLPQAARSTPSVLPKKAKWVQDFAAEIDPENSTVTTSRGEVINYELLLVAVGLETHYDQIPGLLEAVENHDNVGSIYSTKYVEKTYTAIQKFESGNAIYTYPRCPISCPGAPLKICYLHEQILEKAGKRSKANFSYNAASREIFGVKIYADALWKIAKARNINVNLRTNLIEVKPETNEAIFQNCDVEEDTFCMQYSILHAVPPLRTPAVVRDNKCLANKKGYLTVDKYTLQHTTYPNIFGIGDCTSTRNSKTLAAACAQCNVVFSNMKCVLAGKSLNCSYNGYASCPLVTGVGKCILAEFDYDYQPMETFPIRQDRESYFMYICKKDIMPVLYWHLMLSGYWHGPAIIRKILHLGMSK